MLLYYKEAKDGQVLEEGITEGGLDGGVYGGAGTAYANYGGQDMIPFYIYYSMFGFQRVGDLIWHSPIRAARDSCWAARRGVQRSRARDCSIRTGTRL